MDLNAKTTLLDLVNAPRFAYTPRYGTADDAFDRAMRHQGISERAAANGRSFAEEETAIGEQDARRDVVYFLLRTVALNETQEEESARFVAFHASQPRGPVAEGKKTPCRHNTTKREQGWWHNHSDRTSTCCRCGFRTPVFPKIETPNEAAIRARELLVEVGVSEDRESRLVDSEWVKLGTVDGQDPTEAPEVREVFETASDQDALVRADAYRVELSFEVQRAAEKVEALDAQIKVADARIEDADRAIRRALFSGYDSGANRYGTAEREIARDDRIAEARDLRVQRRRARGLVEELHQSLGTVFGLSRMIGERHGRTYKSTTRVEVGDEVHWHGEWLVVEALLGAGSDRSFRFSNGFESAPIDAAHNPQSVAFRGGVTEGKRS